MRFCAEENLFLEKTARLAVPKLILSPRLDTAGERSNFERNRSASFPDRVAEAVITTPSKGQSYSNSYND